MGNHEVYIISSQEERKEFTQHLLHDLKALERVIEKGAIEKGVKRIGVEQEMHFVDDSFHPAPVATDLLAELNTNGFTTEYSKFNLEINTAPARLHKNCFTKLKKEIERKLVKVKKVAAKKNAKPVLVGILPAMRMEDLSEDCITPEPRFNALYNVVKQAKGEKYEYHIKGIDELITRDELLVFGGVTSSFQVHLQVEPEDVREKFNWALAIAGPMLACATNSPLLMGKRLWRETRIAIFEQSTDTRRPSTTLKEEEPRVSFGNKWVENSIMEVFQDDIARYHAFLGTNIDENSLELVDKGETPLLKALSFHNGTIYKWNRVCYGVGNGKPHLRIENRIFPSGPTVEDEVANAAFWIGVMVGMPDKYRSIHKLLDFSDAKDNFLRAAQLGLGVQFTWPGHQFITAQDLILNELLPIAREGLQKEKVDQEEIDHYLGIIEQRIKAGKTGSQWLLDSYERIKEEKNNNHEALTDITAGLINLQEKGDPVHTWGIAEMCEAGNWERRLSRVEQIMNKDVITVQESDILDLAAHIMEWKQIGHIPVENAEGELVGLITKNSLIKYLINNYGEGLESIEVKDIMLKNLITAEPDMPLSEAIILLTEKRLSCLPIVRNKKLAGIVTERDFINVSKYLIKELEQSNTTS